MTVPLRPTVPSPTMWAMTGVDDNLGRTLEPLDRMLGRVYGIWENVLAWEAKVDDSTDDSDAVQGAINYVHARGGGTVYIPDGTCRAHFTIYPNVRLVGVGMGITKIKSPDGYDGNVIEGVDFDTLTNKSYQVGDYARGAYDVEIRDLTVDGNTEANFGIAIWGKALRFHNVRVQYCADDGIWTEFTTHDNGQADNEPGGWFTNIHTTNNGGNGWTFRGPHDSTIDNFTTWGNQSGWGLYSDGLVGSYNGTLGKCKSWNSWLNANSYYFKFGPSAIDGITASAANTGVGIELAAGAGNGKFSNMDIAGHETGLIARGTNHTFDGIILRNATGVQVDGAGYCTFNLSASENDTVVDFVSALGTNTYNIAANIFADTLFSGTPHVSDIIHVTYVDDTQTQGWQRLPMLATADLPTAGLLEGATMWDSTLHQPVWWDGTRWQHTKAITAATVADGVALPDGKGGLGRFENLLLYSEQFDNAAWNKDNSAGTAPTVTANTTTPPTGSGSTADTYTTGSVGGIDNVLRQRVAIGSAIGGRTFTFSIYVRASAGTDGKTAIIRLQDAVSDNTDGIVHTEEILDDGEWIRMVSTYTFEAGNTNTDIDVLFYITTGAAVDTYLWGAQLTETDGVAIYTQSAGAAVPASTGLVLTVDKGLFGGGIGVGNSAPGTTLGSVTDYFEIFDASGTSLGFVPIYDSIT